MQITVTYGDHDVIKQVCVAGVKGTENNLGKKGAFAQTYAI